MRLSLRIPLAISLAISLACGGGEADEGEDDPAESTGDDAGAIEGDDGGECQDGADNDQDGAFDCDDDGCVGSPDCDLEGAALPELTLDADSDSVRVSISGRTGDFRIGFAEVSGSDPWTGEDCLDGYRFSDGERIAVCHSVDGGAAELRRVADPHDVADGYTLFSGETLPLAAVVVIDVDTEECWADHVYFDALGCDALSGG